MASKRTTMLIGLSPSRALALRAGPHVGTEDDDPERKSRRRWFRFDEVFNRLLVSVVACGLALFSVFGGPELEPQPASTSPGAGSSTDKYEIATAHRGDIFVRVTASGTVEPIRLVEISTELSGTIRAVHVDNNDEVKAGQLLAELDPATLRSEIARRSARIAVSITATMIKARSVATPPPDSHR